MKKITLIYYAVLIAIALSVTLFYSCRKDKLSALNSPLNNAMNLRTEWPGVSTSHGLLVFANRAAFNNTLNFLFQDDTANHDTVTHYDPSGTIIYNPVLDAFEHQFNFISLRKDIENREIAFLNGGSNGENPRDHFIADDYLQTLLSRNLEVQISDTIFRYVNKFRIILIKNSDYNTLAYIRQHPLDYYQFPNVTESTLSGKIAWRKEEETESCNAYFTYTEHPNSGFIFTNHSVNFDGYAISTCLWDFGDGTTSTAVNPPIHYFTGGASTHTIYLDVTFFGGCHAYYNLIIYDCYAAFNETHIGAEYSFIAVNPGDLWYYTYSWDFGDGTGTSGLQGPSHTYTSAGTFHVCVTVTNTVTQCVSTYCQDVTVTVPAPTDCVYTADRNQTHPYSSGNNSYKLVGRLWLRNDIIEHRVGASTYNYKWKNGHWADQKDHINDGVYGTFWDNACQNSYLTPISSALIDDHNGDNKSHLYQTWNNTDVQIQTNKIGIKYHSANSIHWISGTNWEIDLTLSQ